MRKFIIAISTIATFTSLGAISGRGEELQLSDAFPCLGYDNYSKEKSLLSATVTSVNQNGDPLFSYSYTAVAATSEILAQYPTATSQIRQSVPEVSPYREDLYIYVGGYLPLSRSTNFPKDPEIKPRSQEYIYDVRQMLKREMDGIKESDFDPPIGMRYKLLGDDISSTRISIWSSEGFVSVVNNAARRSSLTECSLRALVVQRNTIILDQLSDIPEGIYLANVERFAIIQDRLVLPLSRNIVKINGRSMQVDNSRYHVFVSLSPLE